MVNQNSHQEDSEDLPDNGCKYCGGFGMIHPTINGVVDYSNLIPCSCSKQKSEEKRLEALLKYCELPPKSDKMTFDNFNLYPELKEAYKIAKYVADNPDKIHWITFMGDNDTGKTHLAVAICKAWIEKGIAVKYSFVPLLLDELRDGFNRENNESYSERFKRLCNVPLLLLDDLFTEVSTPWVREKLETLVDYRYMNNLSLIVTTNKSLDEMNDISPRLRSRLMRFEGSKLIAINAEEYTLRNNE